MSRRSSDREAALARAAREPHAAMHAVEQDITAIAARIARLEEELALCLTWQRMKERYRAARAEEDLT